MRYLTRRSSGIYYFRYQFPASLRPHFYNQTEFKRSLHTRDPERAKLLALKYEINLRQEMASCSQASKIRECEELDEILRMAAVPSQETVVQAVQEEIYFNSGRLRHCLEEFNGDPSWATLQRSRLELKGTESYRMLEIIEKIHPSETAIDVEAELMVNKLKRFMGSDKSSSLYFEQLRTYLVIFHTLMRSAKQYIESLDIDSANHCYEGIKRMSTMTYEELTKLRLSDLSDVNFASAPIATPKDNHPPSSQCESLSTGVKNEPQLDLEKQLKLYKKERNIRGLGEADTIAICKRIGVVHELIQKQNLFSVTREDAFTAIELLRKLPANVKNANLKEYFGGMSLLEAIDKNVTAKQKVIAELNRPSFPKHLIALQLCVPRRSYEKALY
jgi:hypothetical protein